MVHPGFTRQRGIVTAGCGSGDGLRRRQVAAVGLAIAVLSFATRLAVPYGEEHLHIQFALFPSTRSCSGWAAPPDDAAGWRR